MPIMVRNDLQVKNKLEEEDIFYMDERRAEHQDIRPVDIAVMNLMPGDADKERAILKLLSNTLLHVNISFIRLCGNESGDKLNSCLDTPYLLFDDVRKKCFDGLIITDAPCGMIREDNKEVSELLEWVDSHVTSVMCLGFSAKAALYHFYKVKTEESEESISGIYSHRLLRKNVPLLRGFDDLFFVPHSGKMSVKEAKLSEIENLSVLASSEEAGPYLIMNRDGSRVFCLGHPEQDPDEKSSYQWRSHANALFSNWLNYYVYQKTPFELNRFVFE